MLRRFAWRASALSICLFTLVSCAEAPALEAPDASFGERDDTGFASFDKTSSGEDFCWLPSYGRGVGTIPTECPDGENDAGLCYTACEEGYDGVGPVCWKSCPEGFHDDGAFCRKDVILTAKPSYGRGVGTVPDGCGAGYQKDGALCYPECRAGFYGVGPVCWQSCPDGYRDDGAFCADPLVSVAKNTYTRASSAIDSCPSGYEKVGAICYEVCPSGYYGEVAFCIQQCPSGWNNVAGVCWNFPQSFIAGRYARATSTLTCRQGWQNIAGICYAPCSAGYYGVGLVCWQHCPSGWRDDGAFCAHGGTSFAKDSYGRGAGEPLGCSGGQEYDAGLCYAQCDAGYDGVGPVCWGSCPEGTIDDGATCRIDAIINAKNTYGRGVGGLLSCADGLEIDAGLCYEQCGGQFDGVGPVCWGVCPDGMVSCGAGCATSSAVCANVIINQATSSLEVIYNFASMAASFGTSTVWNSGVRAALSAAEKATLRDVLEAALEQAYREAGEAATFEFIEFEADLIAQAAEEGTLDWSVLDPTGISAVVLAFDYPTCEDVSASTDEDGDAIPSTLDLCPFASDPDQGDLDGDGLGDACDPDADGDGVPEEQDGCADLGEPCDEPDENDEIDEIDDNGDIVEDDDGDADADGGLVANPELPSPETGCSISAVGARGSSGPMGMILAAVFLVWARRRPRRAVPTRDR